MWRKEKANRNPFFNNDAIISAENDEFFDEDKKESTRNKKNSFEKKKNVDYDS